LRPKLIAILLLLVLLPLALLAWMGLRVARNEREVVQHQFQKLLASRLGDIDGTVARFIEKKTNELLRLTATPDIDAESMRDLIAKTPAVSQMFVLETDGRAIFPPVCGELTESERDFLLRAETVWDDRSRFLLSSGRDSVTGGQISVAPNSSPQKQTEKRWVGKSTQPNLQPRTQQTISPAHGWYVWYWGSGIQLIFWQRDGSGRVVGAELNRSRLMADLIAELPHSRGTDARLPEGRVLLADSRGERLYQWGEREPGKGERPQAAISASYPLNAWKLEYYSAPAEVGSGTAFNLLSGLGMIGVALAGLAVYLYRESSRETRDARQRVSFVNQVSHELKTPLTNIRMYAELLAQRMEDTDDKAAQQLDVIVSQSQRLSRLISNVLTFARQQRNKLTLRAAPGCVDDVIHATLDNFRPTLVEHGVDITFDAGAPGEVMLDADVLEQILANLFNNVEKYAASGGSMRITSLQEGQTTTVVVADNGPGIPARLRERVFEPFARASDKLAEGVTGTGIGLAIARDLARLHGGGLTLDPDAGPGACFRLTLKTKKI
jgi:signal transduction histidine kinase